MEGDSPSDEIIAHGFECSQMKTRRFLLFCDFADILSPLAQQGNPFVECVYFIALGLYDCNARDEKSRAHMYNASDCRLPSVEGTYVNI